MEKYQTLVPVVKEAISAMDAAYNRFSMQVKQEPVAQQLLSSRKKLEAMLNDIDPVVDEHVYTEKFEVVTKYHIKPDTKSEAKGFGQILMIERSISIDGKTHAYERLPPRSSTLGGIYPIVYMASRLCEGWTCSPPENLFTYTKTYKVKSSEHEKSDLKIGIEISKDRKTINLDLDSSFPDLHIHTNGHDIGSLVNHIAEMTFQRYLKLEEERQSNH